MRIKKRNGKRILSVTIKRILDECPDTSHLGEYSDRQKSRFSIDRAHREDCASLEANHCEVLGKLERILGHVMAWRTECANDANNTDWESLDDASDILAGLQEDVQACDCGGDRISSREYRYFNPSFNYITKSDEPADGLTPDEVRKYVREDYDRMESLNAGHWCYIGIRADAEIGIGDVANYPAQFDVTHHTVTAGGLWGIESDSNRSYFDEIAQEQLAELKTQLQALGFSARAISQAFKPENIKEENE